MLSVNTLANAATVTTTIDSSIGHEGENAVARSTVRDIGPGPLRIAALSGQAPASPGALLTELQVGIPLGIPVASPLAKPVAYLRPVDKHGVPALRKYLSSGAAVSHMGTR